MCVCQSHAEYRCMGRVDGASGCSQVSNLLVSEMGSPSHHHAWESLEKTEQDVLMGTKALAALLRSFQREEMAARPHRGQRNRL